MKEIATLWAVIAVIVAGAIALVGGVMAILMLFGMSAKGAGLVFCGLMFVGVVVFFSWVFHEDQKFQRALEEWPIEYTQLATYNAERLRGVIHAPEWIEYMAEVQKRYNKERGVSNLVVHADGTTE